MFYYEVFVAEISYVKNDPLTYSSAERFAAGAVVLVPFGKKSVTGFVASQVTKPSFKTKPILKLLTDRPLPARAMRFHKWTTEYYPSGAGAITQQFIPSDLETKHREKTSTSHTGTEMPELTSQQKRVLSDIVTLNKKTYLLHGATGSGKTRVYIELAKNSLKNGESALILSPEISLVPQIAETFSAQFKDKVVILHSGLSKATRTRNWLKILQSEEPLVIIGTRSALFCPVSKLGCIVVDEMHEPSYKQEQAPRYQALRAAGALAKIHDAMTVYGSATPSITEYYIAQETNVPILEMNDTAKPAQKVTRTILDLKDKNLFSRHPVIADPLLSAIEQNIVHHRQSLLFLNRRGTARLILCQSCGWHALCPRCDIPLTYHGDNHTMRCHTCGYRGSPPYSCPDCGSDDILYRSVGTKALVESLQRILPDAVIKRFDTDNYAAEKLDKHFEAIQKGDIDIIVGTQMIGKGLDLPKLSLVGIINADAGLHMPDFSAAERSYQLLHQAIGRVGRGHTTGEVIVQTYNPGHPLLIAAVSQQWHSLYAQELAERKQYGFPPFRFLLKIDVSRKTARAAEQFTAKLHTHIAGLKLPIELSEPAPAFYERSHGSYNWQLVVKATNRSRLVSIVSTLPPGKYTYDLDPINLL